MNRPMKNCPKRSVSRREAFSVEDGFDSTCVP